MIQMKSTTEKLPAPRHGVDREIVLAVCDVGVTEHVTDEWFARVLRREPHRTQAFVESCFALAEVGYEVGRAPRDTTGASVRGPRLTYVLNATLI